MGIEKNLNRTRKNKSGYEQYVKAKLKDIKFTHGAMLITALLGGALAAHNSASSQANENNGTLLVLGATGYALAHRNQQTRRINQSKESYDASFNGLPPSGNQYVHPTPLVSFANTSLPLLGLGEALVINSFNSAAGGEGIGMAINITAGIGCLALGLAAEHKNRKEQVRIETEALQQLNSNL